MLEGLGVDALEVLTAVRGRSRWETSAPAFGLHLPAGHRESQRRPVSVNGKTVFNVNPAEFAHEMEKIGLMGLGC